VAKSSNTFWTDAELVSAVDAYVFMLHAECAGIRYPKDIGPELLLSDILDSRNYVSLRYRMRNISAVVSEMGGPILAAYSPAEQVGTNVRARLRAILASHDQFKVIQGEAKTSTAATAAAKPTDVRVEALERLDQLRAQLAELERELIGIGHNRPPEPLSMDGPGRADFERARQDVQALENQVKSDVPNLEVAELHANRLFEFGLKVALWVGERATKFTDTALKFLAPVVVAKATGLAPVIIDALKAVARAIPF
jgi:hypothetical protein